MQRHIEKPDAHRSRLHNVEQRFEICPLHRHQLIQDNTAVFSGFREDHLAHDAKPVTYKELVLCPAKADALCREVAGRLGIRRGIRIRAHADVTKIICPSQKCLKKGSSM